MKNSEELICLITDTQSWADQVVSAGRRCARWILLIKQKFGQSTPYTYLISANYVPTLENKLNYYRTWVTYFGLTSIQ